MGMKKRFKQTGQTARGVGEDRRSGGGEEVNDKGKDDKDKEEHEIEEALLFWVKSGF